MAGVNKVIALGNLGADPEVRFTGGGQAVCNFRLAVSESWKDKEGKKQERTEWFAVVVWGKLAELCGEYLKKGRQAYVEGKLQTREWEKDGQKRYSTEIVASTVVFLGGEGGGRSGGNGRSNAGGTSGGHSSNADDESDIPF